MSSEQHGRTKSDLSKVKLFFEPGATTAPVTKDANVTKTPVVTTPVTHTPIVTPTIVEAETTPVKKEIPLAPKSKQVVPVGPVDKRKERFSKILQEIWAEAKGVGLTLISPEYMQKIEEALFNSDTLSTTYEDMIVEITTWLIDNEIILRSKPFMKKIRTAFEDTQTQP